MKGGTVKKAAVKKERKLRVGIIGVGGMGGMHSECYQLLEAKGVEVAAVADPNRERLEKALGRHNCHGYATGLELIEKEEVDLVDICTPSYLHGIHALAAMDRKFSVVSEKPVCLDQAELNRLLKKQRETNANMAVAQVLRFWDEYDWLKGVVDKKTFGTVRFITMDRLGYGPDKWYREAEKSGGVVLDLHIHDVDFLYYLFGLPDKVSPVGLRDKDGMINHIQTMYRFGDVIAFAEASWDNPPGIPFTMGYRVNFEKATVVYDNRLEPTLMVYPLSGAPSFEPEFKSLKAESSGGVNYTSLGPLYKELDYFTGCLLDGKRFGRSVLADVAPAVELAFKENRLMGGLLPRAKP
jgi:predicted dehydrogenase